ncbi:MAG: hypothetical protein ACODAQ_05850 [Phycisphaeraceae bacterium]
MTSFPQRLVNWLVGGVVLVLVAVGGLAGYQVAKSRLAAQVYRQRLQQLSDEYEQLRQTYNQAVKRTAVTELIVEDGQLDVRIRTADGRTRTIPTPYDPRHEIYVDYIVKDGRLWIRRVFDQYTPPGAGQLIDPQLGAIDWNDQRVRVGKAVYSQLGEGRWIVTVTGDGSLGLARQETTDEPAVLSPPPEVRDYETIEQELRRELGEVGPGDVVRQMLGG